MIRAGWGCGRGQQDGEGWVGMQAGQRKGPSKMFLQRIQTQARFFDFQARLFIFEDYAGKVTEPSMTDQRGPSSGPWLETTKYGTGNSLDDHDQ